MRSPAIWVFCTRRTSTKVMALASFGKPTYVNAFRRICCYRGNGSYTIDCADVGAHERGGAITIFVANIPRPLRLRSVSAASQNQRPPIALLENMFTALHGRTQTRRASYSDRYRRTGPPRARHRL